mmetsp:Transcript_19284/g.46568  ORF Transcript_19284/g.46568 Transcript_19284/m.46568 type:complete len:214 (-) Transcript_19284:286-927(-)
MCEVALVASPALAQWIPRTHFGFVAYHPAHFACDPLLLALFLLHHLLLVGHVLHRHLHRGVLLLLRAVVCRLRLLTRQKHRLPTRVVDHRHLPLMQALQTGGHRPPVPSDSLGGGVHGHLAAGGGHVVVAAGGRGWRGLGGLRGWRVGLLGVGREAGWCVLSVGASRISPQAPEQAAERLDVVVGLEDLPQPQQRSGVPHIEVSAECGRHGRL